MKMDYALHLAKVSFYYKKQQRLIEDFSYRFRQGVTLLKGYSGSGKTTLLKLATGLLTPKHGSIQWNGKFRIGSPAFFARECGFVFQAFNLLPNSSVGENIKLSAMFAKSDMRQANKWLNLLNMDGYWQQSVQQLSGGQKQRVAIVRALIKKPLILCMDEPTSGLDDDNTEIILKALATIQQQTICLVATHDQRIIQHYHEIISF